MYSNSPTNVMLPRLLEPASEISTHFRCDSCGILLDKVTWKRCRLCKAFDLCDKCGKIPFQKLPREALNDHQSVHPNTSIPEDYLELVSIDQANTEGRQTRLQIREREYQRILYKKSIRNDYDMDIVINHLLRQSPLMDDQVGSLIIKYHLQATKRHIRILSLDGGGVRGYMPIKVLGELITRRYLSHIDQPDPNDPQFKQSFQEAQSEFKQQFDYFAGTSTGGLIAFCVAVDYNILDVKEIYSDASRYFKRNRLGPLIYSKYDPSVIHQKIDDIIDQITFPGNKKISSKHATLLDIRNLLNPNDIINGDRVESEMYKRGNSLEFVDDDSTEDTPDITLDENHHYRIQCEKVLLITAYNTTKNKIMIFNTSYGKHWGYRIADVLKATMAAPTYFPPHKMYRAKRSNGQFVPEEEAEVFIDGGVFANDPELTALWAIRMQWKKATNYHLLCVGTGYYTASLSPSMLGGYYTWILNNGFLINTLMDATGSFTEIVGSNLAKFHNTRRMKLNYTIIKPMALDDPEFVRVFEEEWKYLKNEADFKAFIYFYNRYIAGEN